MVTINGDNNGYKNVFELPKSVGVIYSEVKRKYFPTESQYITEASAYKDAVLIANYLKKLGIQVYLYPGTPGMVEKLEKDKPDMVINLVGSVNGQEYLSSTIPGILESLDVPYTGAGLLGETLAYNKYLVKELLQSHGIPVPRFQLLPSFNTPLDPNLRFPLISKLNEIHGAVEITSNAVSENEKHLRERLKFLISTYQQPVLVEEFIVGTEVTAILLEGLNKKVYLAEKKFNKPDTKFVFATFEDQWLASGNDGYSYEKYHDNLLVDQIKRSFDVLRMSDYGKFDVRIDQSNRYYFIDSNSNPAFGPKESDCALATILDMYGIQFPAILKRLLANTMRDSQGAQRVPFMGEETNTSQD
jgi:D-alanine-D-alanine ligase